MCLCVCVKSRLNHLSQTKQGLESSGTMPSLEQPTRLLNCEGIREGCGIHFWKRRGGFESLGCQMCMEIVNHGLEDEIYRWWQFKQHLIVYVTRKTRGFQGSGAYDAL